MNDTVLQGKSLGATAGQVQVDKRCAAAARILGRMFKGFDRSVEVDLWGRGRVVVGNGARAFGLRVNDPECIKRMVMGGGALSLAEAHFKGEIDYEGDIYEVLGLRNYLPKVELSAWEKAMLLGDALAIRSAKAGKMGRSGGNGVDFRKAHSKQSDSEAIRYHYDVSNDFYRSWLDSQMVYSCGYFESESDTIDEAQENKLDHVCKKLQLKPGDRLLDIGCGWGAMVCWAATHYGVKAHGITLSDAQLEVARQRIKSQGLSGSVRVEKRDYRDLEGVGVFDKVSSIGMFEHVGLKNLDAYHGMVYRLLDQNGLFLNHGITHAAEGWDTGLNSTFLQKYVFPDGELDRVSNISGGMESAGFEILDVESLRGHYAKTLRAWVSRLESNRAQAQAFVGGERYRIWHMYLAGSALEFEEGRTGIHQILGAKWDRDSKVKPLTRRHLYEAV